MAAPLSHKQKSYLSQLARRAWETAEREVGAPEDFRHTEVARACGKAGLRCCSQDDYKHVEAHLLDLCGEPAKAFNAHVAATTQPVRQAEAVLARACREAGVELGYAAAICQRQFRCPLAEASERQLWNLVFTVRNRGHARKRAAHQPSTPQLSTP